MKEHMPSTNDYPARGKVTQVDGDSLVFVPSGTNYQMHLKKSDAAASVPLDTPIEGVIQVSARKVWTVPSGGNFVQPIFGQPRIIQGRVKWLDERRLLVQAGTSFLVELPASEKALDLANGGIEVGSLVNVTALPGATFEPRVAVKT
jgi:hypothetical protein